MSEWWTYTLADFLPFSPQTYRRLFELYNRDVWPGQVVALALGIAAVALLRGGGPARGRAIAAILAASWAWVAWAFHAQRYATINWAATYFAAAFALEAVLLAWVGAIRGRLSFAWPVDLPGRAALALLLFALFVVPLLGPLAGRAWVAAEVFGLAPDPTAVATLGVLLLGSRGPRWPLLIVPCLWCAVSGGFLWAMQSPDAIAMPAAGLLGGVLAALKARAGRGGR